MNKKLFCITTLCAAVTTNVFADTEEESKFIESKDVIMVAEDESEVIFNDKVYVPARNNKFFVGIELPLLSYVGGTVSLDGDEVLQETEIKLNNGVLDNSSLRFGFNLNDALRVGLDIAHYSTETEFEELSGDNSEYSVGSYGVTLDAILMKDTKVSPFVRLGIGYMYAEEDSFEMSSAMFKIGFGLNYRVTENIFSYGVLEYSILPETEIEETEAKIEANAFSVMFGIGYQF